MWLAAEVWAFAGEEANRVAFTLKAGLAMLLVSLLVLIGEPYMLYGTNVVWSILTVGIMLEYTVGLWQLHLLQVRTTFMVVHTFGVVRRMGYCYCRCHVGFNRPSGVWSPELSPLW